MTVAELETRVQKLEAKIATLEQELDFAQAVAGIKRGLEEADRGLGMPAREWAEKVRTKHKLPAK